jgi:acetolactate synthase regulatory subunit
MSPDTLRLTVSMAPTTGALTRLLVLVRGRGATVLDLHWQVTPAEREGVATLLMDLDKARHPHLEAAIARIIDVRSVVVS